MNETTLPTIAEIEKTDKLLRDLAHINNLQTFLPLEIMVVDSKPVFKCVLWKGSRMIRAEAGSLTELVPAMEQSIEVFDPVAKLRNEALEAGFTLSPVSS